MRYESTESLVISLPNRVSMVSSVPRETIDATVEAARRSSPAASRTVYSRSRLMSGIDVIMPQVCDTAKRRASLNWSQFHFRSSNLAASIGVPPVDIILSNHPFSPELLGVTENVILTVFPQCDRLQSHCVSRLVDWQEITTQPHEKHVNRWLPWCLTCVRFWFFSVSAVGF